MGILIVANFGVSIAEAETRLTPGAYNERHFQLLEIIFTSIFTFELIINFLASGLSEFFKDYWSIFDLIVIVISILSLSLDNAPGFSLLRLVRIFRVLRVVRRLQSLRRAFANVLYT